MINDPLEPLLGRPGRDPGCDTAFEYLDRYCEALHRGEVVARSFPGFLLHIQNCAACREDTEGLLATLAAEDKGAR